MANGTAPEIRWVAFPDPSLARSVSCPRRSARCAVRSAKGTSRWLRCRPGSRGPQDAVDRRERRRDSWESEYCRATLITPPLHHSARAACSTRVRSDPRRHHRSGGRLRLAPDSPTAREGALVEGGAQVPDTARPSGSPLRADLAFDHQHVEVAPSASESSWSSSPRSGRTPLLLTAMARAGGPVLPRRRPAWGSPGAHQGHEAVPEGGLVELPDEPLVPRAMPPCRRGTAGPSARSGTPTPELRRLEPAAGVSTARNSRKSCGVIVCRTSMCSISTRSMACTGER